MTATNNGGAVIHSIYDASIPGSPGLVLDGNPMKLQTFAELAQASKSSEITRILATTVPSGYSKFDITGEEWREIRLPNGDRYRIDNPVLLITRKGGTTHRVVDANGVTHCYVAPESGLTVVTWKSKANHPPVKF